MNAVFTNQIVVKLASSKILSQIDYLNLSKGCMTQEALTTLVTHREAFANLKSFIVTENNLDQTAMQALKNLFPFIMIREQKNPDTNLYVSVGE